MEFTRAIEKSLTLRPCTFVPSKEDFVPSILDGKQYSYLPGDIKLLWFRTYCAENNINGQVLESVQLHNFGEMGLVQATAEVLMNDTVVARSVAGRSFAANNLAALDGCIQMAAANARSRALSAAGFGSVSGKNEDLPSPADMTGTLPFAYTPNMPVTPANPTVQANCAPVPEAPAAATPDVVQTGFAFSASATPQPQVQVEEPADPLAWAKATVIEANGLFYGKTMGELLATNPKQVLYYAEKWNRTGPTKDAAVALADIARSLCGK